MRTDYLPSLRTRSSQLLCGHCDCCYYAPDTDSCDYLLVEYKPRGCPPTPDCPRYAPAAADRAPAAYERPGRASAAGAPGAGKTAAGQSLKKVKNGRSCLDLPRQLR